MGDGKTAGMGGMGGAIIGGIAVKEDSSGTKTGCTHDESVIGGRTGTTIGWLDERETFGTGGTNGTKNVCIDDVVTVGIG